MFSKIFSKGEKPEVAWKRLDTAEQLDGLDEISREKPVMIFKHSTRCSISAMSLGRFERTYKEGAAFDPYFIDLIAHREISNAVAERYGVQHESPQVILIKDGKAIYNASHTEISFESVDEQAQQN